MSCPKTQHLLQEYFADNLSTVARNEIEKHLAECEFCNSELHALQLTQSGIERWQEQRVPHWDRGVGMFRQEHGVPAVSRAWSIWQWIPAAASFAMLAVLLLNVSVTSNSEGFDISFGGGSGAVADLELAIATLQEQQRSEMQDIVNRMEDRLDSNNVRLLQAVMQQTQQTTAENFEQLYAHFEKQRLLDLEDMRVGYEQLVNSDYQTIRSLQQLASFVSFEGAVR